MIFIVEFLEEDRVSAWEPARVALEAVDEAEVVGWLARRGRRAYVRRLFDPHGFLWLAPAAEAPGASAARPIPRTEGRGG